MAICFLRLKIGENMVIKPVLKRLGTFLKLYKMCLYSFIRLIVSLNIDILRSIYCGEKK